MTWAWASRLLLLSGGLVASVLLGWLALSATEVLLGIRDPEFRYENAIDMWIRDSEIGFVNRPNFEAFVWGSVAIRTDDRGFRTGVGNGDVDAGPVVVGVGDSVMWGTGVSAGDSLLGRLQAQLRDQGPVEVIDAGVVGYSSLQELRLLEKSIVGLDPDVVLVNYCNNDLVPTEDPFDNVRAIHADYLEELLSRKSFQNAEMRASAQQMIALLRSNRRLWRRIDALAPATRARMMELLIERPILEMVSLVRASGGRLILLIIPPRAKDAEYARSARRLSQRVRATGGEVVDLTRHLVFEPPPARVQQPPWLRWVPQLERILRWRGIRTKHQQRDFVDGVHPSIHGNDVIATQIALYLRSAEWWRADLRSHREAQ